VLNSCFEDVDFTKVPLFEVEYAFLKLRAKSVGEIITPKIVCPVTNESHIAEVDINQIELNVTNKENIIKLSKDLKILLKYPTIYEIGQEYEDINELVSECIVYFENNQERVEKENFDKQTILDFLNHLTVKQYEEILKFFDNMPIVKVDVKYTTSDEVERTITIKGLKDFFC
ncbi:MAG: hypothetical protein ACO25K_07490, partial [Candidatus Fonsibacter ubiquis]